MVVAQTPTRAREFDVNYSTFVQKVDTASVPWEGWPRGRVSQNFPERATHMVAIRLVLSIRSMPVAAQMRNA